MPAHLITISLCAIVLYSGLPATTLSLQALTLVLLVVAILAPLLTAYLEHNLSLWLFRNILSPAWFSPERTKSTIILMLFIIGPGLWIGTQWHSGALDNAALIQGIAITLAGLLVADQLSLRLCLHLPHWFGACPASRIAETRRKNALRWRLTQWLSNYSTLVTLIALYVAGWVNGEGGWGPAAQLSLLYLFSLFIVMWVFTALPRVRFLVHPDSPVEPVASFDAFLDKSCALHTLNSRYRTNFIAIFAPLAYARALTASQGSRENRQSVLGTILFDQRFNVKKQGMLARTQLICANYTPIIAGFTVILIVMLSGMVTMRVSHLLIVVWVALSIGYVALDIWTSNRMFSDRRVHGRFFLPSVVVNAFPEWIESLEHIRSFYDNASSKVVTIVLGGAVAFLLQISTSL